MTAIDRSILRLLDADLNRALEGLRVLEECSRMIFNNETLTRSTKSIRHDISAMIRNNPSLDRSLLFARNSASDVLKSGDISSEATRNDIFSILRANAKRTQEAIRSIEEFGKLVFPGQSEFWKDIRFRVYNIERDMAASFSRQEILSSHNIGLGVMVALDHPSWNPGIIKALDEFGVGLLSLSGGTLTDSEYASSVSACIDIASVKNIVVLIDGRFDIAQITRADGVILDDSSLSPAACRETGNHLLVIARRVTEQTSESVFSDDSIDLFILPSHFSFPPCADKRPRLVLSEFEKLESSTSVTAGSCNGILFDGTDSSMDTVLACISTYRQTHPYPSSDTVFSHSNSKKRKTS